MVYLVYLSISIESGNKFGLKYLFQRLFDTIVFITNYTVVYSIRPT